MHSRFPHPLFRRLSLLVTLVITGFALPALHAAPVSVAGSYEAEGTVVTAKPAYDGPVAMRALLSLEFNHARGRQAHGGIAGFEVVQEERSLKIITKNADGRVEWTGEWTRNGGFQATEEGVKFLIRAKRPSDEVFMFTLTPASNGAAMTVQIQRIENTMTGPLGHEVGVFLFLRAAE